MMHTESPPGNGGYKLGELQDSHTALLEAYADAEQKEQAARVDGDPDAIRRAGWATAEALGDIRVFELELAWSFLMGLQFAVKRCPSAVSQLLSQVPSVQEIAEAVAALESREGVTP